MMPGTTLRHRRWLTGSLAHAMATGVLLAVAVGAGPHGARVTAADAPPPTRTPFAAASAILKSLREDLVPPGLLTLAETERQAAWPQWIERHYLEIRARLLRGNEDSILNLALFGTSFTTLPREDGGARPRRHG